MTEIVTNIVCEGGVCRMVEVTNDVATAVSTVTTRLAEGVMSPDAFIAFLHGETAAPIEAGWWAFPLAFLAGLALNLTPCVLPMIPVNLMIIGKSVRRSLAYGAGMAIAFGALGLAAALGGLAFGTIQANAYFNLAVAVIFVAMGLALGGVWNLNLARYRFRAGAFLMGALSAVLAGACVAPVLVSVLLLTARLSAEGHLPALALPFTVGVGMASPWPFLGAGMKALPRPGSWMKWVNRAFAAFVFALAFHYAHLALKGFAAPKAAVTPERIAALVKESPRPILVDCYASWCKNCAAMDEVLKNPRVQKALTPFTVIRLDAEDIRELRHQIGFEKVNGLPAFVIFE